MNTENISQKGKDKGSLNLLDQDSHFKQEALSVIESLLQTISWLGGDAYEMEASEPTITQASDFLNKHKPQENERPFDLILRGMTGNFGIYCLKNDESRRTEACNKRVAAKYFGVGKNAVKCMKEPYKQVVN